MMDIYNRILQYHKNCQTFADSFLQSLRANTNVRMAIDSQHEREIKENRERLVPNVKTIILCGRLGISYRSKPKPKNRR